MVGIIYFIVFCIILAFLVIRKECKNNIKRKMTIKEEEIFENEI
jgi:preprotein translocase subunit YajC